MNAQEQINAWGRAKYPGAPAGDFSFSTGADAGCDTCGYGSEPYVEVRVGHHTVERMEDVDLTKLLLEIIAAGAA